LLRAWINLRPPLSFHARRLLLLLLLLLPTSRFPPVAPQVRLTVQNRREKEQAKTCRRSIETNHKKPVSLFLLLPSQECAVSGKVSFFSQEKHSCKHSKGGALK
jgi:hypothetical protein